MKKDKHEKDILPEHVAIIMDGNRRWAKKRGLPAFEGHRRGALAFEKLVDKARKMGIKCLSTWAFSTENWKRSQEEVDRLFSLIEEMARKYEDKCGKEKVRFVHIGRKDRIPQTLRDLILKAEEDTKDFTEFTIVLALDYGGHDELLRSIEKIQGKGLKITPENIEKNLDTTSLPQIDYIIRTGGEQRLSGFMSWQCAYAELFFTDTYFPAFSPKKFEESIKEYSRRERRFGGN
ncbi:di-trans,poly-cis-decaprenylcistransferase [Patescibacteria group bacterium]|nr:di-trans,poly-cis-decaprenylcistransferase [Patescibacteria group bacterium]